MSYTETIFQDLRFSIRTHLHDKAVSALVLVALTLGIGPNAALFSVISAVLLRPLPFARPERLMAIIGESPADKNRRGVVSYLDVDDIRSGTRAFDGVGAWTTFEQTLTSRGLPADRANVVAVSAELFPTLGVRPVLGHGFTAEDDRLNARRVAIVSRELAQRRFVAEASAIGEHLSLGDEDFEIIGVMPAGFRFPLDRDATDVWVPLLSMDSAENMLRNRDARFLFAVGRLKDAISAQQARVDLADVAVHQSTKSGESTPGWALRAQPLRDRLVGDGRQTLLLLMGAVGLVLLMACGNVANVLLARSLKRRTEIATRIALGATRARIIRQLLTESLVLSVIGGILGSGLAFGLLNALGGLLPRELGRLNTVRMDVNVLLFTTAISTICGLGAGLAPAMVVARNEIHQMLVAGSHGSVPRTAARVRACLVIVQVAMAITVLSGATLLVRSAKRLHDVDPGFDPRGAFAARIIFDDKRYANLTAAADMNERLVSAAKSIPGVQSATTVAPNALGRTVFALVSPGDRVGEVPPQSIWLRSVGPNFASTMGIRLVAGRDVTTADGAGALPVVLVNQAAAEQLWPGQDPLEKTALVNLFGDVRHMRVVGVVRNVRHVALEVPARPEIYASFSQAPFPSNSIVLRSGLAPGPLLFALRAEIATLDARLPVPRIESLETVVAESLASRTFALELLTAFALMAVILSAVGTYAVAGYEVVQRTREIGIRAALGASPSRLLWMVVSQSAKAIVLGVLVGAVGAVVLTSSMRGIVFGVTTTDPWAFAAAVVPLLCVTLAASCLAALGAVRVQPSLALRSE